MSKYSSLFQERTMWLSALPRPSGPLVVLALAVFDEPLNHDGLTLATGLERRALNAAVEWLEAMGVVERVGDGWTLSAAAAGLVKASGTASDAAAGDGSGTAGDTSSGYTRGARNSLSSPPPKSRSILSKSQEEEEGHGRDARKDDQVRQLLIRAGVGRRSRKLAQLVAMDLDPAYVSAWIDHQQQHSIPVNHLIQSLTEGDPVPVCNCGRCAACQAAYVERLAANGVIRR